MGTDCHMTHVWVWLGLSPLQKVGMITVLRVSKGAHCMQDVEDVSLACYNSLCSVCFPYQQPPKSLFTKNLYMGVSWHVPFCPAHPLTFSILAKRQVRAGSHGHRVGSAFLSRPSSFVEVFESATKVQRIYFPLFTLLCIWSNIQLMNDVWFTIWQSVYVLPLFIFLINCP